MRSKAPLPAITFPREGQRQGMGTAGWRKPDLLEMPLLSCRPGRAGARAGQPSWYAGGMRPEKQRPWDQVPLYPGEL